MKSIPVRRRIRGWNRRILTMDDFYTTCKREGVLIYEAEMHWRGLYFIDGGQPVILLNSTLRNHQRVLTAFHELAHHFFHHPGCHGYHDKTELEADVIAHVALMPAFLLNLPDGELSQMFGYEPELVAERVRIFQCFNL